MTLPDRNSYSNPKEPETVSGSLAELVARAQTMIVPGERRILGVAGAPGAGKSTLCAALAESLGDQAALVGMDGFHLANAELRRLGRRGRKGAPDTFDAGATQRYWQGYAWKCTGQSMPPPLTGSLRNPSAAPFLSMPAPPDPDRGQLPVAGRGGLGAGQGVAGRRVVSGAP
ncbi:hypothetical protein ACFP9V_21300 [Deinococcus radiopugnans]|uniref:hypothetical protein n=1 Tax=Deinococcus radiopugnans TaxID=57497 RepID=UPI0036242129